MLRCGYISHTSRREVTAKRRKENLSYTLPTKLSKYKTRTTLTVITNTANQSTSNQYSLHLTLSTSVKTLVNGMSYCKALSKHVPWPNWILGYVSVSARYDKHGSFKINLTPLRLNSQFTEQVNDSDSSTLTRTLLL